jgi:lipopolysaccharide export system permease protein
MTVIDRYLAVLFAKVVLVCFISLAGLYVVIDGFNNFDEFWAYGQKHEWGPALGPMAVLADYYGARMLWFFDRTAGLLAMIAVVFAVTWLQRTTELTALMAAGISPARAVWPLLVGACVVAGLGVANREFGLPLVRDKLARNAQDWLGSKAKKCTPRYDLRSDVLIAGQATFAKDRRIESPQFRLPTEFAEWGRLISADNAFHLHAAADRPAGYLLRGVKQPANLPELPSQSVEGTPVLLSPRDYPWLAADECFVVSMVNFEHLTVGGSWRQYLSSYELITGLQNHSIEPGADVRVTLHARLVQPLIDLSLVLLGLPLVLTRNSRNIFLAAGICVGLVATVFLVVLTCHGLGSNYLLDPVLAAWIPLVVFGPLAYTIARPLWD